MKKLLILFLTIGIYNAGAQTLSAKLQQAVKKMEQSVMQGGMLAMVVQDAQTGEYIYQHNHTTGLPAASTQKVITSATGFALLGKDYQYTTHIYYSGEVNGEELNGDIYIKGSGDPSFGSWRWDHTKMDTVLKLITEQLLAKGIRKVQGNIFVYDDVFDQQSIPGGWTYQDMGNYYGAGVWGLNWNENQYDLVLEPGKKIGDPVTILQTRPDLQVAHFQNNILTAAAGTGDKAYIYLPPYAQQGFVQGTIPAGKTFTISGSIPYPAAAFARDLELHFAQKGIILNTAVQVSPLQKQLFPQQQSQWQPLGSIVSPAFDQLSYWFLRKSINLYGEAFVKTFPVLKGLQGSTKEGIRQLLDFWKEKGIPDYQLKMVDGSGLSPENRITAQALVTVLQYARKQSWYRDYLEGFPLYNNMKLKSGTIAGVKAFAGYHTAANGKQYNIVMIAYNYNTTANQVVQEMYKVLNLLK